MTRTEERLRAALAAKADSVTRADLRRPVPPTTGGAPWHGGRRLRTAALLALAAALIGAALLLPGALARHTDQPPATRPGPTASPSPSFSGPVPAPAPARPSR